ncbi:hypothetical protein [Haladaptatus cibarius]|nr:hypothetical protein [Haladaptatus cibarius]
MTIAGKLAVVAPIAVAGPVVLWPLLLLFLGGLLLNAMWSLIRGRRGRE